MIAERISARQIRHKLGERRMPCMRAKVNIPQGQGKLKLDIKCKKLLILGLTFVVQSSEMPFMKTPSTRFRDVIEFSKRIFTYYMTDRQTLQILFYFDQLADELSYLFWHANS